jgi:hypothetical protein
MRRKRHSEWCSDRRLLKLSIPSVCIIHRWLRWIVVFGQTEVIIVSGVWGRGRRWGLTMRKLMAKILSRLSLQYKNCSLFLRETRAITPLGNGPTSLWNTRRRLPVTVPLPVDTRRTLPFWLSSWGQPKVFSLHLRTLAHCYLQYKSRSSCQVVFAPPGARYLFTSRRTSAWIPSLALFLRASHQRFFSAHSENGLTQLNVDQVSVTMCFWIRHSQFFLFAQISKSDDALCTHLLTPNLWANILQLFTAKWNFFPLLYSDPAILFYMNKKKLVCHLFFFLRWIPINLWIPTPWFSVNLPQNLLVFTKKNSQ